MCNKWLKKNANLGARIGSRNCQKWDRRLKAFFTTALIFRLFFGSFLHGVLEVLGCLLGGSWVSWGSLGRPLDPKTCKNSWFFKVFEKTLWSSWWPSWAHLGFSCKSLWDFVQKPWSKEGPKTGLRWVQDGVKMRSKKSAKKKKWSILGSFFEHFWALY